MGSVVVAEFDKDHKLDRKTPPAKLDHLAGFLAMNRYGRITIEQYALSRQISHQRAVTTLKQLREEGLVSAIRLTCRDFPGKGPMFYGLTNKGYGRIKDRDATLDRRMSPPGKIDIFRGFWHEQDVITAVISARAQLADKPFAIADEAIDFQSMRLRKARGAPRPSIIVDGAKLVPDVHMEVEGEEGQSVAYLIEVDRGTEPVSSLRANRKTIVDMYARYWRFLETTGNASQYRILLTAPDEKRVNDILAGVPWDQMRPIDGMTPDQVFRLAVFDDAVGSTKAKQRRVYGNFWGSVWRRPMVDGVTALLKGV